MGGHLGGWGNPGIGKPETSDDQHHTLDPAAAEPDWTLGPIETHHRPETLDEACQQIAQLWAVVRHLGDDLEIHLERGDSGAPAGDVTLTDDRIVEHAAAKSWPVVRCGEPCGFIATAATTDEAEQLLQTHVCGQASPAEPTPPPGLGRLVVGCVTFIAVLIIIGLLIEDLAGVH